MSIQIVAEMAGSHNGNFTNAIEWILAAKRAGADAVKFQTFTPENLVIDGPDEYCLLKDGPWKGRRLIDLYRETMTPREWHADLFKMAKMNGLIAFSTPFHPDDVDFLETLDCPIYKVASAEITDIQLLNRIAQTGKPVYISTGMATTGDMLTALKIIPNATLLHCISNYPADPEEMNMGRMDDLREIAVRVGLSDHSITPTAAILAVAKGATVIEKHMCLNRSDKNPDAHYSLEPSEFRTTVQAIREAEAAMRLPIDHYGYLTPGETSMSLRKSLWIVKDVKKGEAITFDNVKALRPERGLPPQHLSIAWGMQFNQDIKHGTPLTSDLYKPL